VNFLTWTYFSERRHREPLATHHATIPDYLLQNWGFEQNLKITRIIYSWLIRG
jgi:hypothetical protein